MNLTEFSKEVHANAIAHGWWEEERPFDEIIALIHSELSEALEEYRNKKPNLYYSCTSSKRMETGYPCGECQYCTGSKPEGVAVELADVVIRILDYCGREGIDIEAVETPYVINKYTFTEMLVRCHNTLSLAFAMNENAGSLPKAYFLRECIAFIKYWFSDNGINFDGTLLLKHEYNKGRPYKHGGKAL